jgi:hypothetical protein
MIIPKIELKCFEINLLLESFMCLNSKFSNKFDVGIIRLQLLKLLNFLLLLRNNILFSNF